jgi:hypothetical protein
VKIFVWVSLNPAAIDTLMLCDDCGARRGRDWWRSRQSAPAGIDCDDCGACTEAREAFTHALETEKVTNE